MRSLLLLVLIAALGAGGYMSKPDQAAHKSNADKVLQEQRARDGEDLGDVIGGLIEGASRDDKFEDMLVATKYTARSGDKVLLECWGAFTQFFCSNPNEKK